MESSTLAGFVQEDIWCLHSWFCIIILNDYIVSLQVFLKVCAAADKGKPINPETVKEIESEEEEVTRGSGKEWSHDFENNGTGLSHI